jgi:hypothetical protein
MEKRKFLTLPGLELRPLCCPARSQSLYRLRYLGSYYHPRHRRNIRFGSVSSSLASKWLDGCQYRRLSSPCISTNTACISIGFEGLRVAHFSSSSRGSDKGARLTGFRKPELGILSFPDHILSGGYKSLPFPELADCEQVQWHRFGLLQTSISSGYVLFYKKSTQWVISTGITIRSS